MTKVGHLTFHRAINYGAILQTYALQQALNNLEVENEVIDYRCKKIEDTYKLFEGDIRSPKKLIGSLKRRRHILIKSIKIKRFIKNNINISKEKYISADELKDTNSIYDRFIVGSDQVWNDILTDFDSNYFLKFVKDNNKKISYAASFGFDKVPERLEDSYRNLLKNYNNISVRENTGLDIVNKMINKKANIVCDPTMLIDKEQWGKLAKNNNYEKYIFVYTMRESKSIYNYALNLANAKGLQLFLINATYKKIEGFKKLNNCGIEEFLGLIKNAEYVITNSFHGVVMSSIFNKSFFVELQSNGATGNSRIKQIISTLGLEDRYIIEGKNMLEDSKINYSKVNSKILELRKDGYNFLKKSLI